MPSIRRAASAVALLAPLAVGAQSPAPPPTAPAVADPPPATMEACYVPASGTVYRINTAQSPAPGAPNACLNPMHVRFLWNAQGPAGPAGDAARRAPSARRGTGGRRARRATGDKGDPGPPGSATVGPDLALAGRLTVGQAGDLAGPLVARGGGASALPTGASTRLLWVPERGAFGVGRHGQATPETLARFGTNSLAAGADVMASGSAAVALGISATASGTSVVAVGHQAHAGADHAVALGRGIRNDRTGAIVIADGTVSNPAALTQATTAHELLVRASGGVRLRTAKDLSTGCDVGTQGVLACTGGVSMTGSIARVDGPWVTNEGARGMRLAVICPAATIVVGGGVQQVPSEEASSYPMIWQSYPDETLNAWVAEVSNDTLATHQFRVRILCMRA